MKFVNFDYTHWIIPPHLVTKSRIYPILANSRAFLKFNEKMMPSFTFETNLRIDAQR